MVTFETVIKALHIMSVVAAFGPPLAFPFIFAYAQKHHSAALGSLHDVQLQVNRRIVGLGTVLVLVFGAVLATKEDVWSEVWVTIPLVIILVIGGVGGALINPAIKRLSQKAGTPDYDAEYRSYLRYELLLGALVLVAIFVMTTKPG